MKVAVGGVVVFIAAYIGLIVLYAATGMGPPHTVAEGQPAGAGTTVTIDIDIRESSTRHR